MNRRVTWAIIRFILYHQNINAQQAALRYCLGLFPNEKTLRYRKRKEVSFAVCYVPLEIKFHSRNPIPLLLALSPVPCDSFHKPILHPLLHLPQLLWRVFLFLYHLTVVVVIKTVIAGFRDSLCSSFICSGVNRHH